MNAKIKDKTLLRISNILQQPVSRGIDRAINACLDKIEARNDAKEVRQDE